MQMLTQITPTHYHPHFRELGEAAYQGYQGCQGARGSSALRHGKRAFV